MDKEKTKELSKKILGRKYEEKRFNESFNEMSVTEAEPVAEAVAEDIDEEELEGSKSNGFSQPSHVVLDNNDNKLYLATINLKVYPNVMGYGFDEMFKRISK